MRFNYNFWKTLNDRGIVSMSKVYCPEILDDLPSSPRTEYLKDISEGDYNNENGDDEQKQMTTQVDGEKSKTETENPENSTEESKRHSTVRSPN